jgi:peptidoglycan/xylan/chitin deacetylase (PgdA/CDA1 family)
MAVRTDQPLVAITFDDGPDDQQTPRILKVLAREEATATFFLLAQRAARLPEIVEAILDGGHEIALHGDDHSPLINASLRSTLARIRRGRRRLEAVAERRVRYLRPPYGWQDVRSYLAARAAGLTIIGWSAHGSDWLALTPAEIAGRLEAGMTPGSILLLHDRKEPLPGDRDRSEDLLLDRAAVVEEVLAHGATRGVRFVSLGTLLTSGSAVRRPWFWRPVAPETAPVGE